MTYWEVLISQQITKIHFIVNDNDNDNEKNFIAKQH